MRFPLFVLILTFLLCSCGSPTAAPTAYVDTSSSSSSGGSSSGGPITTTVTLLPDLVSSTVDIQPEAHVASPDDTISVSFTVWNRPAPPDEVDAAGNITHYVRLPAPAPSATAWLVDNDSGELRPGPWQDLDMIGPGVYAVVALRFSATIGFGIPHDVDGTVTIYLVPGIDPITNQAVEDADGIDNDVVLRLVWGAVATPPFAVE